MPLLVHLNGPPAVGKSTLAAGLVERRPLALNLDIDQLRVRLGRWQEHEESKQIARDLGFLVAAEHLRCGYDVVLPQLLVRPDVIRRLEALAADAGATFCEILLVAPADVCIERLAGEATGTDHPRRQLDDMADRIAFSCDAMADLAEGFPAALVIDAAGPLAETLAAVEALLSAARG